MVPGVRQYTAKTVDFGASDGAVSDAKQKLPMVHIPMTGGAIVPATIFLVVMSR